MPHFCILAFDDTGFQYQTNLDYANYNDLEQGWNDLLASDCSGVLNYGPFTQSGTQGIYGGVVSANMTVIQVANLSIPFTNFLGLLYCSW
jgi:hypothetical protein